MLDVPTLAYVAGIIDTLGIIRTRVAPASGTELPMVALSGSNEPMLQLLGDLTGTKVTVVRRQYLRVGCADHCREKHQHITSVSGRWSVSGVKATVLLYNIRPYLRLQVDDAVAAIDIGLRVPYKAGTLRKMADLGWHVPEFNQQQARVPERGTDGRFKESA